MNIRLKERGYVPYSSLILKLKKCKWEMAETHKIQIADKWWIRMMAKRLPLK